LDDLIDPILQLPHVYLWNLTKQPRIKFLESFISYFDLIFPPKAFFSKLVAITTHLGFSKPIVRQFFCFKKIIKVASALVPKLREKLITPIIKNEFG
jgi:hypothetical protein